jgi:transcriptional regulator with XRE-family HTH domain
MGPFPTMLRRCRRRVGLSQSEVARKAKISPSYVSRLEREAREPPSRDVSLRLAAALGMDSAGTDALLLAAGHAPQRSTALAGRHRVLQLVADLAEDERVPVEEIEVLERQVELVRRRWQSPNPRSDE